MSNFATLNRRGRKPGQTNLATREKQAREAAAVALLASQIGDEAVAAMSPLEITLAIMAAAYRAGNLSGALVAAQIALPYTSPRKSTVADSGGIPYELLPDPPPAGDEPQPEHPIY